MKKIMGIVFLLFSINVFSQDVSVLFKEASNLERTLKEEPALEKYKQILSSDPNNLLALVKASALSASIGGRQTDKKLKADYYNTARNYAEKAIIVDANSADANYVRAVAASKLAEVEPDNKKAVTHVKDTYTYANKAVSINPEHGRANYLLGKWHYEMITQPWTKKATTKLLFGGIPEANIEDAFKYMEKCRSLEPYYVQNFYDLATAYKYDHKPSKAIEVLNQLVKLPIRTGDDAELKTKGRNLLSEMQ
jgi:tetratricopeptide (TPR) repeat protein